MKGLRWPRGLKIRLSVRHPGTGAVQKQKPEMILMRSHRASLPCIFQLSTPGDGDCNWAMRSVDIRRFHALSRVCGYIRSRKFVPCR